MAERDEGETTGKIPGASPFHLRARYITAAIHIRAEKYDEAIVHFSITQTQPKINRPTSRQTYLALGRLYYDRDMLDEAVNAYQFISFDSEFFSEMLYEVTWVYVRRGQMIKTAEESENMPASEVERMVNEEYKKALDQLRMLVDLESDSRRTPDAYVLMGNLRLQRGEFDAAEQLFEKVVQQYEPTYDSLKKLSKKSMNPKKLLDDILAVQQGGLATDSQLPPLAATWTSETDDVTHVLATFRDLQISEQQMKSSLALVEELDRILNRDHPENSSLPEDGVQRARGAEKRLLALERASSAMTEKITGGMGTGGKTLSFSKITGKDYTLTKAIAVWMVPIWQWASPR